MVDLHKFKIGVVKLEETKPKLIRYLNIWDMFFFQLYKRNSMLENGSFFSIYSANSTGTVESEEIGINRYNYIVLC